MEPHVFTDPAEVDRRLLGQLLDAEKRRRLLMQLRALHGPGDAEIAHSLADQYLLDYIGDPEVTAAFDAIEKWYA